MEIKKLIFSKTVAVDARLQISDDQIFLFANGHTPVRVKKNGAESEQSCIKEAIKIFEKENNVKLLQERKNLLI
ncbi:hypothetical protein ACFVHQ_18235 [Actinomycetes bacterium NPDC127524]|jgi:hypothetical protein|uniref:hypothetical protein n=1 Tax=Bacillaceae TaxID=186817 RepID=UPI0008EEDC96|nr:MULTISPECIES: hypothetical protein [unclassified Bacillus (in: firmicutes)]OIK09913.1 hypothetical protein BIV59_15765 [Bacillus sp. MUM 13]SFC64812.1 hypothetical protein SAMN05443252_10561 [Bacillus sp. OV322]